MWITCHLVTFLHFDRSLPSRLVSLIKGPLISLMVISNLVIGLPYFLFLLIHQTSHSLLHVPVPPHARNTSKPPVCATFDSSVHSGSVFLSTRTSVFLSIHHTLIAHLKCINFRSLVSYFLPLPKNMKLSAKISHITCCL